MQEQQGVVPTVITYSALISACKKGTQVLGVLQTMQRQGVVPMVISYSALISAREKGRQSWRPVPRASHTMP